MAAPPPFRDLRENRRICITLQQAAGSLSSGVVRNQGQGAAADADQFVLVIAHFDAPNLAALTDVERAGAKIKRNAGLGWPQVVGVYLLTKGKITLRSGQVGADAGDAFGQGNAYATVQVAEGLQVAFVYQQAGGNLARRSGQVFQTQGAVEAGSFENAAVELWHSDILCEDTGVETIAFLPGYLSPPSGFAALAEKMEGYRAVQLEPAPTPAEQLQNWRADLPDGAHLVASFEAGLAAVRLAVEKEARSLVWFSPYARVDAALQARLRSLAWALEKGGVEGFVRVGAPLLFGSLMLDRGGELIEAWRASLSDEGLQRWVESLLEVGDERKWLRTLKEQPVLAVVGSEDVFTPMRYAHDVTEWIPELHGILVTLEGAGHFSFWENPREGISIARGFIERYREFLEGPAEWQTEDEDEAPPPLRFEPEAPK